MRLDSQQMLLALNTLLSRAVEVSPESARLRLKLQSSNGGLLFSIFDEGGQLTDEQRQSFFAFLTNERINRNSLNLALARRIVEAHGGHIAVLAAEPSGSEVRISV
jgi:K+-sensing histidine kinase KdpD